MIIELCNGGTVKKLIKKYEGIKETLLFSIMKQVLEALTYCHARNIAHRDIKPENIFIMQNGRIVLGDFGFSCQLECSQYVKDFCGSQPHKSPEHQMKAPYNPL